MIQTKFQLKKTAKHAAIREEYARIMAEQGGNPTAIWNTLGEKYGYHPIYIGKIVKEQPNNENED